MNKFTSKLLTGTLVLSLAGGGIALACDSGQMNSMEAGESTFGGIPLVEGSKNFKHLKEVAAVPLKEIKGSPATTADVYAYKGFAYLGTHRGKMTNEGVRIFDMKDPSNPKEVAVIANDIPGTWQEKVIVQSVSTPSFKGDLAAVSVQRVDKERYGYEGETSENGGVVLYDVTDPKNPKKLGFWKTPSELPTGTHEFWLTEQNNRVLVLATNYMAHRYKDKGVDVHDFSIVDVTDPSNPKELSNWDPTEVGDGFNGDYQYQDENGAQRTAFLHSVIADQTGKYAYLSYWDLGTVILNIEDPANPKFVGRTKFERHVQGAAHSAALAHGGNILIETRENFNPDPNDPAFERGWGYVRIYDIKDKSNPVLLSTFRTLNSMVQIKAGERKPGSYTVHDPKVRGNTLYLSHYADGIRMVDLTDPANPVEVGSYVSDKANVWGVFVDRNYILASDMGQGLKVLQKNADFNANKMNLQSVLMK
ncbi:LVIVD repeat-containing protein [Fictibacillus sp. BK138]|jgi:hypothetical protein|uniref:LVIVD repeat-containing protein n=1 Tax=Fictibacillus sp. BK138 TaxID=2512121 RepID=UPI00102950D9|nr:hypothetical protein [Fictibacillus sp. BK138]RZT21742.1 hypothetical protein EV282_0807 [Fictibacillus sp. BK138]